MAMSCGALDELAEIAGYAIAANAVAAEMDLRRHGVGCLYRRMDRGRSCPDEV